MPMHWYFLVLALPRYRATLSMGSVSGSAGEVVGANGRIGSLLLRAGLGTLAAVPRGMAPGALSPAGTPIIVATHASALTELLEATPVDRICDIVLLCNGMAREQAAKVLGVTLMGTSEGAMSVSRFNDKPYGKLITGRIIVTTSGALRTQNSSHPAYLPSRCHHSLPDALRLVCLAGCTPLLEPHCGQIRTATIS